MSSTTSVYERLKQSKPLRVGNELGFDGRSYLVALSDEDVYALAAGAYYVWTLCDGVKTVEEIVKDITSELSTAQESDERVSEEELREPVAMIVDQLAKVGLVKFI